MPIRQVITQMRNNFGKNWAENFTNFDEKPFAAASIGQVKIFLFMNFLSVFPVFCDLVD